MYNNDPTRTPKKLINSQIGKCTLLCPPRTNTRRTHLLSRNNTRPTLPPYLSFQPHQTQHQNPKHPYNHHLFSFHPTITRNPKLFNFASPARSLLKLYPRHPTPVGFQVPSPPSAPCYPAQMTSQSRARTQLMSGVQCRWLSGRGSAPQLGGECMRLCF